MSLWGVLPEVASDATAMMAVKAASEVLDFTIGTCVVYKRQA